MFSTKRFFSVITSVVAAASLMTTLSMPAHARNLDRAIDATEEIGVDDDYTIPIDEYTVPDYDGTYVEGDSTPANGFDANSVVYVQSSSITQDSDGELKAVLSSCTGVLLTPSIVLTAAHCFDDSKPQDYATGLYYIDSAGQKKYLFGVYPGLYGNPSNTSYNNIAIKRVLMERPDNADVALVELAGYTDWAGVTPISTTTPTAGDHLVVYGWGAYKTRQWTTVPDIQATVTQTLDQQYFNDLATHTTNPTADELEALNDLLPYIGKAYYARTNDGQATVQGDSGGPVIGQNGLLLGILSHGIGGSTDAHYKANVSRNFLAQDLTNTTTRTAIQDAIRQIYPSYSADTGYYGWDAQSTATAVAPETTGAAPTNEISASDITSETPADSIPAVPAVSTAPEPEPEQTDTTNVGTIVAAVAGVVAAIGVIGALVASALGGAGGLTALVPMLPF